MLAIQLMLFAPFTAATGNTYILEAQHGFSNDAQQVFRGGAKNGIAVLIKQEGYLFIDFKVQPPDKKCSMRISNVRYSNNGLSDAVELYVNETKLGELHTRAKSGGGELWNVFLSTGPIGESIQVTKGIYQLKLYAINTDEYGVEIDSITLSFNCMNSSENIIEAIINGSIGY